jgi:MHS family citrate/tricarballylate:H+ symporter-like MFS transporter
MYDFFVFGYYASAIGKVFFPTGRRIPFLIGCLIIPLLFILRYSLKETEEFEQRRQASNHPTPREILLRLGQNWSIVIIGMLLVTMTTVSFYFITAYTPTFGREVLKLSNIDSLIVTMCVGVSNLFWLPVMGAASDRLGRKPLLILFTLLMIVTAYPALSWLVSAPSFARLLTVELWLSFIYASYNGAMVVALTEIVPLHVRTSGFAVAYSLATATFVGFTPAVVTYLIHATDNRAVAGLWLMFAAACGLVATLLAYPQECRCTTRRDKRLGADTLTRQWPDARGCGLLGLSGHPSALNQCPLLGVKRTSVTLFCCLAHHCSH